MSRRTKKIIEAKGDGKQMVEVIFNNLEVPGAALRFSYRDHETPLSTYEFHDGQKYTVPVSVMNHINQNTSYPIHHYKLDEDQKHMMVVGKKVKRYFLEPVNMRGLYRPDNDIVTVERVPKGSIQLSV